MTKIGIIIDNYHLNSKVAEFLKYLKTISEIRLYIEESYLFSSEEVKCDEDIFFVKAKGPLILNLVKYIEELTSIPVINSYKAICLAINRFLNSTYLRKAGIPVPDFSLNPAGISPPFEDYIIKNIVDQKNYKFKPIIKKQHNHLMVADERALNEVNGTKEQYKYMYYQKFIKSEWEYKLYGIGEEVYYYKQKPVLINPNKLETRQEIPENSELKEYCLKAMEIMNLKITSLDFHKSNENEFFLTDINCTPNFNYIKDGHKVVADFLINYAKK